MYVVIEWMIGLDCIEERDVCCQIVDEVMFIVQEDVEGVFDFIGRGVSNICLMIWVQIVVEVGDGMGRGVWGYVFSVCVGVGYVEVEVIVIVFGQGNGEDVCRIFVGICQKDWSRFFQFVYVWVDYMIIRCNINEFLQVSMLLIEVYEVQLVVSF